MTMIILIVVNRSDNNSSNSSNRNYNDNDDINSSTGSRCCSSEFVKFGLSKFVLAHPLKHAGAGRAAACFVLNNCVLKMLWSQQFRSSSSSIHSVNSGSRDGWAGGACPQPPQTNTRKHRRINSITNNKTCVIMSYHPCIIQYQV